MWRRNARMEKSAQKAMPQEKVAFLFPLKRFSMVDSAAGLSSGPRLTGLHE
jgi:hypothetical protein